ncbi:Gfo/Idh/MocA family oxidoreductase [Rouxiella sp. T17]|uniref:Gfo/Idh/MocA family protein n=1 Tax=Rouxiella sp. T17 TaxID=3085684 RepID=UPI002FC806AA
MKKIGIGIIGTGFMGTSHALAYRAAGGIFSGEVAPELISVADVDRAAAEKAYHRFGFRRYTDDWQALINDPEVDVVSITTPNKFHLEQALAAIKAGKHVHCEKPIAPNSEDAKLMTEAAEAKGVITQVGFNYLKNPLIKLAKEMIEGGELGEIVSFRGIHAEDFMGSPHTPWSWRLDPKGGAGAIADLGSHIIAMARYLLGPIVGLNADLETVIKERPVALGASELRKVEVDDIARLTVEFARGCKGNIEANWVATGRKMQLGFEIYGTLGGLHFTQERFNELNLYRSEGNGGHHGFQKIEAGPEHLPYGAFCPAPGHQLGFNDLKTIEMAEFLRAVGNNQASGPDFREAWEIQKIIDATLVSSKEKRWVTL